MEFVFGKRSKKKLDQVHYDLQETARLALSFGIIDFAVIEGARSKSEQNRLFMLGKTKVRWPHSKHNIRYPGKKAEAIDIVPWVNGSASWEKEHCILLAGAFLAAGAALGHKIRWGGNWDMDGEPITDQDFQDLGHFEKRRKK